MKTLLLSPMRTRPLRVLLFGDGPRPYAMASELIYGKQDSSGTLTQRYLELVGWVGDHSLIPSLKSRRCTRFGSMPNTYPEPELMLIKAKPKFPNLDIPRWRKPILQYEGRTKALRPDFLEWFRSRKVDLCLMSTYATLIPIQLIELVQGWFINFHPTRKNCTWPEFGGCTPWEDMYWHKITEVAIAAYFIDEKFDRGQFITESESRLRIPIRNIGCNNRCPSDFVKDADPNLEKSIYTAICDDPDLRGKGDPLPGFIWTQQYRYLIDNHFNMAPPTAKLVNSLARQIWHIRRREIIPHEINQLDYFQRLQPKL